MKRNANEMLEIVKAFVGDRTDDDALNLIEDVKDSMTSSPDQEDWKAKYDELDKSWREKYKARFFEGNKAEEQSTAGTVNTEESNEPQLKTRYEELFKEET